MGKFVTTEKTNREFQFNLKTDTGQGILSSEGYSSKSNCENCMDSVRKNSPDDNKYDR